MMPAKQKLRQKELYADTVYALSHTCQGLVELHRFLLESSHDFVMLGKFTTDPQEKMFSKLWHRSGSTYFTNTQQVFRNVKI